MTPRPEDFAAYPALDDHDAWRRTAADGDRMLQAIVEPEAGGVGVDVREWREGALAYETGDRSSEPGALRTLPVAFDPS